MALLVITLKLLYRVLACLAISDLHAILDALGSRSVHPVHAAHTHCAAVARDNLDIDWLALLSNSLVVKVVEGSRLALVENSAITKCKVVGWRADGETSGVDGTSLSSLWIELKLAVVNDGAGAALRVEENTIVKVGDKSSLAHAGSLLNVSIKCECQHQDCTNVLTLAQLLLDSAGWAQATSGDSRLIRGDRNNGDLEGARVGANTARWWSAFFWFGLHLTEDGGSPKDQSSSSSGITHFDGFKDGLK